MEVKHSVTGDGQHRTTYNHDNGTTREVTDRKDGGITVTDTDSVGGRVSGDGVAGWTGSHNSVVRQTTWDKPDPK